MERLIDLDELVLRCRNDAARSSFREAILSYRAGAIRAAIVAAWTAVVHDYVSKIRELDLAQHKDARVEVEAFEKALSKARLGVYRDMLEFEKTILDNCVNKFEFISHLGYEDLERLRADRNRCAHPSMPSIDEVYEPPAELARYHLRSAVEHMLMHRPVQGKAALDIVLQSIASPYFPIEPTLAEAVLSEGPMGKPRKALLRNLVSVLIKRLLRDDEDEPARQRVKAALAAIRNLHPEGANTFLEKQLPAIASGPDEDNLRRTVNVLEYFPDFWNDLPDSQQELLKNFVERTEHSQSIIQAANVQPLFDSALRNAELVNPVDLYERIQRATAGPKDHDLAVEMLAKADSFDRANSVIRSALRFMADGLGQENWQRILNAYIENEEVTGAFDSAMLIRRLLDQQQMAYKEMLIEFGQNLSNPEADQSHLYWAEGPKLLADIRNAYPDSFDDVDDE